MEEIPKPGPCQHVLPSHGCPLVSSWAEVGVLGTVLAGGMLHWLGRFCSWLRFFGGEMIDRCKDGRQMDRQKDRIRS